MAGFEGGLYWRVTVYNTACVKEAPCSKADEGFAFNGFGFYAEELGFGAFRVNGRFD